MKKASREMGFGDDWKKAVEKVKDTAVPPGGQPRMIMDLLDEAVAYLRAKDLDHRARASRPNRCTWS